MTDAARRSPLRHLKSPPLGVALVALVVAIPLAPDMAGEHAGRFVDLFAGSAAVIAALLVVMAVEVTPTTFRGLDLGANDVKLGLFAGAAGLVAAVAGTSESLPEGVHAGCFVVTVGGGLGCLAGVLTVGVKAIDAARKTAVDEALYRRARLGDTAAQKKLIKRGEWTETDP